MQQILVIHGGNAFETHELGDDDNLDGLARQGGKIFLYHSRDDKTVRYVNCRHYQDKLPQAIVRTFEDRGHFEVERLPEIVEDIQMLG